MVIQSPFKDYYDFVAHRYGGGDPKIVYLRDRLAPLKKSRTGDSYETSQAVEVKGHCPLPTLPAWRLNNDPWREMYLVVAAKAYLLKRTSGIDNHNPNSYTVVDPLVIAWEEKQLGRWRRRYGGFEFGKEMPFLVELSRKVHAPVFAIEGISQPWRSGADEIRIPGLCPVLAQVGMPALVSAEQMYQDLAYFVGNTMKPHPDTEPPVAVSNKEKILKAGFDLKKSFRHRL